MHKLKNMIIILIVINIFLVSLIGAFQNVSFALEQTVSNNIDGIDDTKYPGIKAMIKDLQSKYPTWNFKVLYTKLNWNDAINGETQRHGTNLVQGSSIYYDKEWICTECGQKSYDSGSWNCASEKAVKYMMDPRNSLNENDIFQFLQLSYVETKYEDLQKMVANYTYLNKENLISEVIRIGNEKNVNPFFIMAKIIQEQGNGTSVLATGAEYTGADGVVYSGYFNLFNIGASGNGKENVITNGLKYAKDNEWTTPEKSIEGGISTIANNYIKYGQDTMYFQKFNVSSTKYTYYTHQYMQNVLGAQHEGTILRKNLQNNNLLNESYTFIIPLYEGMPETACAIPISTYRASLGNENLPEENNNEQNNMVPEQNSEAGQSNENIEQVEEYTVGDLDNNNQIDAMDMYNMIQYILEKIEFNDKELKAADLNNDGNIDAMDMYLLIQKIKEE